ncbi:MAG: dethiobiotin synthase [Deltaproteobacteria bacterium]|nr:dethiobiotin synthase [bacterium]MCB9479721.1 dethiobiotin synthase [Deltaproteobacteria bacterium]MCB9488052.1 dethiobiotin synthase [Deltaproteobacteria bacterium]
MSRHEAPAGLGILMTGTDTGVGKTQVGCILAKALRRRGLGIGVCKPMESGWPVEGLGSDSLRLVEAAGTEQTLEEVCPYRLSQPVTPLEAARIDGVTVDKLKLIEHVRGICSRFDVTLVEGAGGLLSPLAPSWTALDLAKQARLAALIVVANQLGCLNHALMTERLLLAEGVRVIGFVFNSPEPGDADSDYSLRSNERLLRQTAVSPVLGCVAFTPPGDGSSADGLPSRDDDDRLAGSVLASITTGNV